MNCLRNLGTAGIFAIVLVGGLARDSAAMPQTATSGTTGVAKVDDGLLQSRISGSIKKSATLAPRDIDVSVNGGVVTLQGKVRTATEKTRAGQLAAVNGVARVDNQIEIDPNIDRSKIDAAGEKTKAGLEKAVDGTVKATKKAKEAVQKGVGKSEEGVGKAAEKTSDAVGKAGDKMADAAVTTKVKAGFSDEPLLKDTAITVETTDHVVTLKGTVASNEARARAAEIARGVEGVTRIVNMIVVVEH